MSDLWAKRLWWMTWIQIVLIIVTVTMIEKYGITSGTGVAKVTKFRDPAHYMITAGPVVWMFTVCPLMATMFYLKDGMGRLAARYRNR